MSSNRADSDFSVSEKAGLTVPVLIIGADPTGLNLALWLTRFGVPRQDHRPGRCRSGYDDTCHRCRSANWRSNSIGNWVSPMNWLPMVRGSRSQLLG